MLRAPSLIRPDRQEQSRGDDGGGCQLGREPGRQVRRDVSLNRCAQSGAEEKSDSLLCIQASESKRARTHTHKQREKEREREREREREIGRERDREREIGGEREIGREREREREREKERERDSSEC
jgi:zinc finger CCCH domain-containing protein 13